MVLKDGERRPPIFDGSENDPRCTSSPKAEKAAPIYDWLEIEDLTPDEIAATLDAYQDSADQYSALEWEVESIKVGLERVFPRIRSKIETYPKSEIPVAVVAAAGSFKDLLTLALMQYKIRVFGFDITPEMLRVGQEKLTWNHIVEFAAILGKLEPSLNAWIKELIEHVGAWEDHTDAELRKVVEDKLIETFQKKILVFQGDLKEQYFREDSVDVVMAVACLQHLQKDDAHAAILQFANILKRNNGSLYFNLRLDPERVYLEEVGSELMNGRVFTDRVLAGDRYYNTYTLSEVHHLMAQVIAEYQKLDLHSIITYEVTDVSNHPDLKKPPFINIVVTKKPRKR